jgi:hypothetical protein
MIVNKKYCKEKLDLERRLVCKKKEKTVLDVAADAITCNKTRMKQSRTIAEFCSPLFAQTQITYLTFIFLTLKQLQS